MNECAFDPGSITNILHEVIFIIVEVFARDILLYFFSLSTPAEVVEGIGIVIFFGLLMRWGFGVKDNE